jgi:hypothetical protein
VRESSVLTTPVWEPLCNYCATKDAAAFSPFGSIPNAKRERKWEGAIFLQLGRKQAGCHSTDNFRRTVDSAPFNPEVGLRKPGKLNPSSHAMLRHF